jgi:hypothetical protein
MMLRFRADTRSGGANVTTGSLYCAKCVPAVNRENLLNQAKLGRIATHSAIGEARRSVTQARQARALRNWHPSDLPTWLDEDCYRREILPRLSKFTVKKIRLAIDSLIPTQRSSDAEYRSLIRGIGCYWQNSRVIEDSDTSSSNIWAECRDTKDRHRAEGEAFLLTFPYIRLLR